MRFLHGFFYLPIFSVLNTLITTCSAQNSSTSIQNYTLPRGVTLDRLFAIEPSFFLAPESTVGDDNCTAPTQSLIRDGTISIILPAVSENTTESLDVLQTRALNESLPFLLQQLGVKSESIPKLVAEGIPLFKTVINDAIALHNSTDGQVSLVRRGLFSSIVHFVQNVVDAIVDAVDEVVDEVVNLFTNGVCQVFAAGALPGYQVSYILFNALNVPVPWRSTTADQNFYIHPLHGPIYRDSIRIYYNANFAPGFGSATGVTMGRAIYLRAGPSTDVSQSLFPSQTRLLLHEFTHTKQYRSVAYIPSAFGLRYLFNYCKAGFSYEGNVMEKDANAQAAQMNTLLGPIGLQFLRIWKARNLGATLGLPIAKTFVTVLRIGGITIYSLRLQGGRMFITCNASLVCS
ncbi:hypothetical protein FRC17_010301 [Serendipita sp. 399]|nr:hypothetical protein FRC17_010301 [Serendipita sp. 399]